MYTVKQAAERLHISEHTLRYYDRQGLMPFLRKSPGGVRAFTEEDLCLIELILCLKNSRMSLSEIRQYIQYQISPADTTQMRKQILLNHKRFLQQQMLELRQSLCAIDYKLEHCIGQEC